VLKGDTFYNGVPNGNIAGGTTGYAGNGTLTASNKVLSNAGTGASTTLTVTNDTNIAVATGQKVFLKARARVKDVVCTNLSLRFDGTTGGDLLSLAAVSTTVADKWEDFFAVATVTNQTGKLQITFRANYIDTATQNGKVMEVDGNVGVFAIPITGTPYESMTATEINNKIGAYFEGLKGATLETVGSRGKNLFDKSKATLGKQLQSNGAETAVSDFFVSDFIRVGAGTIKIANGGVSLAIRTALYDVQKNFLSYVSTSSLTV
jgi:hypothetical protein